METVKFSDVVTRANTKEDRFNTDKIYYVGGEHIDSNEMKIEKRGIIAGSTIGPMFYCGFKSGDILFVTRNPHLRKCGVVDFDGICSEKTFVLETKNRDILLQEYLAIVMQSDDFWNYCEENKSGGVNYFLNWSTLAEYEFYLPSLAEQKVLAEKLWAAYEVKQSYLKMIAATEEMVKAKFVEMFGDAPKTKVGDFCELKARIGWQGLKHEEFLDNGDFYLVTGVDFVDNRVDWDNCHYVTKDRYDQDPNIQLSNGDVLITKDGTIGKVAIVSGLTKPATLNSGVFVIRDKQNLTINLFMFYALLSKDFESFVNDCRTGSTIAHLNQKAFVNYLFPTPPIDEQKIFVEIAKQADKSISELRKSVDAIDKVIKSLINENL